MNNPLLNPSGLPAFSQIQPEHINPAINAIIANNNQQLCDLLKDLNTPCWATLAAPLEAAEDRLDKAFAPVSHLNSVQNTPQLRDAYNEALQSLTAYHTALGQNNALYNAYEQLAASDEFNRLNPPQQKALALTLRDFRLAGVDLADEKKARFAEIKSRLSQLSSLFANQVLDATQSFFHTVTDERELKGLPALLIQQAEQLAQQKNSTGWIFTLDMPVYLQIMTQAQSEPLRQLFYTAFVTKASELGPGEGKWNNQPVMEEILQLRLEMAQLLGFAHFADYSLASKMAQSPQQVLDFLTQLAAQSRAMAEQELTELTQWTRETYGKHSLEVWDVPYYSERLKEARYSISQELLREYFPLPRVLKGLFSTITRLFGVVIQPLECTDLWHADAQFYGLYRDGELIAQCYLDLYAREGKKGGAWMGQCQVRRNTATGLQLPVAFLVCNFSAPVGDTPSLLTHQEVTTLFHEFGHGLHHMLSQIDVAAVSGINGVAWDAVELPSQFLENFCWQKSVLKELSGHYQTGEPLGDDLLNKMLAAKNYQSALQMLRQLEFAIFDMRLHMEYGSPEFISVQALIDEVRSQVAVIIPPEFNRFQLSFSHIFAGGYAAGYYSYKWAEVLSCDAFAAFEENGLFDPVTGARFLHTILQRGGAVDAMQCFIDFRGREPSVDALLRHSGINHVASH
ncbi:MAG: M3 family peptidase [Moraxellaceae bacterium]|nr:MAG: M3 family peptidase [Moraxellaceae bacterium]